MSFIEYLVERYEVSEEDLSRRWDRVLSDAERKAFLLMCATPEDCVRVEELVQVSFEDFAERCSKFTLGRIVHRIACNFDANLKRVQEMT